MYRPVSYRRSPIAAAACLLAFGVGCGGSSAGSDVDAEGPPVDAATFSLIDVTPGDGETGVSLFEPLTATFSVPLDKGSLEGAIRVHTPTGSVAAEHELSDDGTTLTIRVLEAPVLTSQVTVTLDDSLMGQDGHVFAGAEWHFEAPLFLSREPPPAGVHHALSRQGDAIIMAGPSEEGRLGTYLLADGSDAWMPGQTISDAPASTVTQL